MAVLPDILLYIFPTVIFHTLLLSKQVLRLIVRTNRFFELTIAVSQSISIHYCLCFIEFIMCRNAYNDKLDLILWFSVECSIIVLKRKKSVRTLWNNKVSYFWIKINRLYKTETSGGSLTTQNTILSTIQRYLLLRDQN